MSLKGRIRLIIMENLLSISFFIPQMTPWRIIFIMSDRWGNQGTKKLNNLPKVIHLINVWGRIWTEDLPVYAVLRCLHSGFWVWDGRPRAGSLLLFFFWVRIDSFPPWFLDYKNNTFITGILKQYRKKYDRTLKKKSPQILPPRDNHCSCLMNII